jgi:urease accessory protein
VRTRVAIVARAGPGGRTVLPVVRASGQLAVRRTGPAQVHLVATAFGPLGGDDAEIHLVVEEGASLTVRSVAAAIALPSRGDPVPSTQRIAAEVAGTLDLRLEPTVVAARAHHLAELTADLTGEEPGRWTGTTRIERAGRPLLHTTVGLGPGAPAWLPPGRPRAYASTVQIAADETADETEVATGQDAVRLPLPGGWVATAWGAELHRVVRAAEELDPRAAVQVPA